MSNQGVSQKYSVDFKVYKDGEVIWKASFTAHDPENIKNLVSACCAFNSGDDCRCWINGEEAVLEDDWGLMT